MPDTTLHQAQQPPAGWNAYLQRFGYDGFHLRREWSTVLQLALRHEPHFLWLTRGELIVGVLPLQLVSGPLFGRYLVSQPYLNTGGVLADSPADEARLIEAAVELARRLDVKHLELRHERQLQHPAFNALVTEKVHMRLPLPATPELLWERGIKSKLRSQIRKPLSDDSLSVAFGREELLDEFYRVFARNMRDLGTPPYGRALFAQMLAQFPAEAEIVVLRHGGRAVAAGFLLHAPGCTLIPSASALREYNHLSVNVLMYWRALERSIQRGQPLFDFGRSTVDSGTYKFKQQWGAVAHPAYWQYHSFKGSVGDARPSNGKFALLVRAWQKLPVWFSSLLGPHIVRGIP